MEGVEDIPGAALVDGIKWDWETFPEYLDDLERNRWVADVGAQIPHGALRAYVMGDRCADGIEASDAEIDRMAALTGEALSAGALGFSTSRTPLHKSIDGDLVPGTSADVKEIYGIAEAMAKAGHGVFEVAIHHPDVPESFTWLREVSGITGNPVVFNFNISDAAPHLWRDVLELCEQSAADGVPVNGQIAGRPVGILQCWDGTVNPFKGRPSFEALGNLSPEERKARLNQPEVRAAILSEEAVGLTRFQIFLTNSWNKMLSLIHI